MLLPVHWLHYWRPKLVSVGTFKSFWPLLMCEYLVWIIISLFHSLCYLSAPPYFVVGADIAMSLSWCRCARGRPNFIFILFFITKKRIFLIFRHQKMQCFYFSTFFDRNTPEHFRFVFFFFFGKKIGRKRNWKRM